MSHFIPPIDLGQFQPSSAAISSWLYQVWKYLQDNPIASKTDIDADVQAAINAYMAEHPFPVPPVLSVNAKTGAVVLAYNDFVKPSYTLPVYRASSGETSQADLLEAWDEGCRFLIVDDDTPFMMLKNIVGSTTRIDLVQLAIGGEGHGVTSVNGMTDAVTLTYTDFVGDSSTLPIFYTTNDATGDEDLSDAWEAGYRFAVVDGSDPYIIKRAVSAGGSASFTLISIANNVTSVNNQTGDVTLFIPTKTSDLQNDSGFISGNYVSSVNGASGMITIGHSMMINLAVAGWSSATNEMTVIAVGIDANSIVWVSPDAASFTEWGECAVRCISQGNGQLTFKCNTIPANALVANVAYI